MKDPLKAFEKSLAYMFELQTKKTGKYIHPAVQTLKQAIEAYKNEPTLALPDLVIALKQALPVIDKYVDSYLVKLKMEDLAKANGRSVSWELPEREESYYYFFQPKPEPKEFTAWLSFCSGLKFREVDRRKQVEVMLEYRSEKEFMTKLAEYLIKSPDFLGDLLLESFQSFIAIMNTRIGFQLKNEEIAKAICHHSASMQEEGEILTSFWNDHLVLTGRSIEKLLQDPLAKAELEKSVLSQLNESMMNFKKK